jgi:hypothetical protein
VFYWQSRVDFEESFDIVFTLRDAESGEAVRTWQVPLGSDEAKQFWKANEVINTIHQFEVGTLVGGRYHLDISLQNQVDGQTEPVKNGSEGNSIRIENLQENIVVRVED